jgi:PhnB protein
MHVTLPISDETVLMGADMIHATSEEENTSKNFSLYVNTESKSEATQLFNALSDGGSIILPISSQFWGSYYGTCIDKFGIHWKVSFSEN